MTKTVTRSRTPKTGLAAKVLQYLSLKFEAEALTKRGDVLKKDLMEFTDLHGEEDDRGHKTIALPTPLEIGGKTYTAIKRERRVSQAFDEEVAEEILVRKGLYAEAVETITVLDQDRIYVLNQEGRLTDDELDSMFVQKESFAFKPVAE